MFYFLNENTEIDLSKVSMLEKKYNIFTAEENLVIRVDGKDIKVDNVKEFMQQFKAFRKQEALNKQYVTV